MNKQLNGEASQEQINEWKEANPQGIFALKSTEHISYHREPDRHDMNIAASETDKDKPLSYYEVLFRETKLGGSEELVNNDKLFAGMVKQLQKKIEGTRVELVNL